MADGEVVYKVDVDDSDASKQLDEVNSKIENKTKESSKKQQKTYKENANEFEKQSKKMVQDSNKANDDIANGMSSMGSKIKESLSSAFNGIGDSIKENAGTITQPLDDIASNVGLSFSSLAKAGVVGGILAIGTTAVNQANNVETAMRRLQTQTGMTNEEAKKYEDVMLDIYKGNYGESMDDVADAMSKVKQQFKGLNDEDLKNVTEGALTLRDSLEMDLNEAIRGTDQLMTQFDLTATQAMDLMAKGAQNGLNYTDELGDNVAEYAGKFSQAGYSASEYFQLLENGSQGGAYNLDKVNDAINEVTTRLADGTIKDSLGSFSKETQKTFKEWEKGNATQKDVIDSIVNDIKKCTNEQDKLTMSATAFGTMGEDANVQFIESLTTMGDTYDDVDGSMNKLKETAGAGLNASLQELTRSLETLLVPLGQVLIPVVTAVIDILTVLIGIIGQLIQGVVDLFVNWEDTLAYIQGLWDDFCVWFQELIDSIVSFFTEKWEELGTWFNEKITAITDFFKQKWQETKDWFNDTIQGIYEFFVNIWNSIYNFFVETINNIKNFFINGFKSMVNSAKSIFSDFKSSVQSIINNIKGIFKGIIDFITGVFTGNWRKAWNGVKSIFSNIISGVANIFKAPINAIISGINTFIGGLNKIRIPSWVPEIGGFGINIPKIPRLKVGMDFVPSDFYPAYLDYGEAVLTKEQNAQLRSWGGIEGVQRMVNSQSFSNSLDIDYEKLANAMAMVNLQILLDGNVLGQSVTGRVDRNMGIITSMKGRYGTG